MDKSTELMIRLKYNILTSRPDTWTRINTYPYSALSKWLWRCANSVECFAKSEPGKILIFAAKDFRQGKITLRELDRQFNIYRTVTSNSYDPAVLSSYRATRTSILSVDLADQCWIGQTKWPLYITWLIEELALYDRTELTRVQNQSNR